MLRTFLLTAFIALLASVNLKAETITIGEIEPCYNQYFGCDYIGPNVMVLPSDYDPDCLMVIEYYKRVCGGFAFDIQITSIHITQRIWSGLPKWKCIQNVSPTKSDTWKEAFVKLYAQEILMDSHDDQEHHFTTQKQCSKWVLPDGVSFTTTSFENVSPDTLVIVPGTTYHDPFGLWSLDTSVVNMVPIQGRLIYCESACCCYKLQRNFQNEELLALMTTDPCLNVDGECPGVCSGSCAEYEFHWLKYGGFIGKISIDFNNPIFSTSSILPNPNDGTFDIKLNNTETGILKIVVFDTQGNELFTANANKNSDEILTSIKLDLSSGSYFLYLSMEDRFVALEKFIVNK